MWKDLTLRQRALLIQMGVRAGIGSANTIRKLYDLQNTFAAGGVKPKILVSGTFADSETGDYRHPIEAARQKLFPYYKDYVASLNKSGDPLDDAALYYNFHQMMLDAFYDLEKAYGNKFNDMTDMQLAALLSAYFQGKKEGRNIVGKGSPFYWSYMLGSPVYDYIKASTGPENALRKMWWEYNDTHHFPIDKEGYNRFGEAMSFSLPTAVIEAPKKTAPTTPTPPVDWEYNEEVVGMPPLQEKQKEENEKPILKKVVREKMPGFDPEALYTNFGDKDNHRYKTFKYELDPDKVIMDNKALELRNLETVGFLQRMLDIYSPVEDEFYVNPMLHANGGNLLAYGGDEPDWSKLYKGVLYNTDLNSIDKDPLYSIDSTGKVVYPQYKEWSNGNPRDAMAPAYMSADYNTPQTFGLIYDNLKSVYDLYNARIDAENRRKNPKLIDYYLTNARTDIGLRPIGMGSEYTDGIERAVRDYIPYSFNKGVEVLTLPLKLAIDGMLAQPNSVGGTSYSAANPNQYTVYTEPNPEVSNNANTLMSYTMPSTWAKKLLPDEVVDLLNNTEWGNAVTNAFDLYTLSKAPKIIKETPKAVDYVMAKTGNKPAAARYVARTMAEDIKPSRLLKTEPVNYNDLASDMGVELEHSSDINLQPGEARTSINILPTKSSGKQVRIAGENDYPIYTGLRFSISDIVNPDGTVNPRAAMNVQRTIADSFGKDALTGNQAFRMEDRLENPKWHKKDKTTYDHTKLVAQSAYWLPIPEGFTKQAQMAAALVHDVGKILAGDGHEKVGAALVEQAFPDAPKELVNAVAEHMGSNQSTTLGTATRAADIANGNMNSLKYDEPDLYNQMFPNAENYRIARELGHDRNSFPKGFENNGGILLHVEPKIGEETYTPYKMDIEQSFTPNQDIVFPIKDFIIQDAVPRIIKLFEEEYGVNVDTRMKEFLLNQALEYLNKRRVVLKDLEAGVRGSSQVRGGEIKLDLNKEGTDYSTLIHEYMHGLRDDLMARLLERYHLTKLNGTKAHVPYSEPGYSTDRDIKISRDWDIAWKHNGILANEGKALNDAFGFTTDFILNNENVNTLAEKAVSMPEMRSKISEKLSHERGHLVIGDELDTAIKEMSKRDLANLLEDTNGYTQNFLDRFGSDFEYNILSKHPMLSLELIKSRWDLYLTAKRLDNLDILENSKMPEFKEALEIGKEVEEFMDNKVNAWKNALIKVGAYTIPTVIGTMFGIDNKKAYGGNLFASGSRLKSPIDPPTNPWGVSYKPAYNYDVKYNLDNTVEPLWFYDWAPEGTNRDTVAPGYMFENGVNENNATLGNLYNEYWDKTQAYNREINKLNHPELFWDTYHDAAVREALNGSASDIFNGAIKGLLNIASAPIELYKGFAIPGYTPYNLFGNNHPMVSLVSDVIDKGVGGAFSIVNPLSYIDWGSAGMEGSHVKLPWNPNSNGVETPAVIDAAGFIAMPYVAKGLGKAGKYVKNKYTDWFDPYTSFNANFGYYGNPMQRFWGTIARKFNLPDKARLPEVLRKQDGDVRPVWSGRKPGHVNMTIDRGVVPHSNGTWLERDLYITDPTTVFNEEIIPSLKSIEPSDVFVDGMSNEGIVLDPSKTTIVSGNVVSLELAKQQGMSTLSSKRARELYEKATELDAAAAAAEEERNPTSRFSFEKPKYKDVVSFANNYWVEYAKELQRLQSRRGTPTLKDIKALEDMTGLEAHVKPIEEFSLFKDNVLKWFSNPSKYERPVYPNGNPVTGKMWILKSILDGSDFPYNKIFYDRSSPIEFNTPGAWLGGVRLKANGGKLI